MEFMHLDTGLIARSPTNPRHSFPAEAMAELTASVKVHGVLQPITVRPWPDDYAFEGHRPSYELVAGERRWRAAKAADLETVPALIRSLSTAEVVEIQVVENLQRSDLHPLDEAEGYDKLLHQYGYTAESLAEKIGKSRSYIFGRLKLLALGVAGRQAFADGKLTASTALLIARIPGEELQAKAIDAITSGYDGILSYRTAARIVQRDYCLFLDKAPFPQENLMLVIGAGACSTCPKRSGTDPELHVDIERPDVCTDPTCYKAKTSAWMAYQRNQAQEKDIPVIAGDDAKKLTGNYGIQTYQEPKGHTVLDHTCYDDEQQRTYREIIGATDAVLLEDTYNDQLVEVVPNDILKQKLEAAGVTLREAETKKANARVEEKLALERKARERLFQQMRAEAEEMFSLEKADLPYMEQKLLLAAITLAHWGRFWTEGQHRIAKLWQVEGKNQTERIAAFSKTIPTLTTAQCWMLILDMLYIDGTAVASEWDLQNGGKAMINAAGTIFGIDFDETRKLVKAEEKPKKPASAKTTSTPQEAPPGGEPERGAEKQAWIPKPGDTVRVRLDAVAEGGWKLSAAGQSGIVMATDDEDPDWYIVKFNEGAEVFSLQNLEPAEPSTPTQAAPAADTKEAVETDAKPSGTKRLVEYRHPECADLEWSGRGRKPKWVEAWLATDGHTLEQLRVANGGEDQSRPPAGGGDETPIDKPAADPASGAIAVGTVVRIRSTAKNYRAAGHIAIISKVIRAGIYTAIYGQDAKQDLTNLVDAEITERLPDSVWPDGWPRPAAESRAMAEAIPRCTKTLELPLTERNS